MYVYYLYAFHSDDTEAQISIKLNMHMLQIQLEITADKLVKIFNEKLPHQSNEKMRETILRELYGIRDAIIPLSKQQSESYKSISKSDGAKQSAFSLQLDTASLVNEAGPSTSSLNLNSPDITGLTPVNYEQSTKNQRSPQVGQKRSHKDLNNQPTKVMRDTTIPSYFSATTSRSDTSKKNADNVATKSKGSHTTRKNTKKSNSSKGKRRSRCSKSERYLCPVCSLPVNCGDCENCLYYPVMYLSLSSLTLSPTPL